MNSRTQDPSRENGSQNRPQQPQEAAPAQIPVGTAPASAGAAGRQGEIGHASPRPWTLEDDIRPGLCRLIRILDARGEPVVSFVPRPGCFQELLNFRLIVAAVNALSVTDESQSPRMEPIRKETRWRSAEVTAPPFTIHEAEGDRLIDPRNIGA